MNAASPEALQQRCESLSVAKRDLLLDRLRQRRAAAATPRIARRPPGAATPLSFAQERIWFLQQLEPQSPYYNLPACLSLAGAVEPQVLAGCLQVLVARHEALRTVLRDRQGEPIQVILSELPLALPVVDLGALPAAARTAEAARLALAEGRRTFDLARGPLLRALLVRLAPAESWLALTVHHAVSDGWSTGVMVREITTLYQAARRGVAAHLPELPIQYADYAIWQRRRLAGAMLADQLAYWRSRLTGPLPTLELPADRPRPAVTSHRGRRLPVRLSAALTASARELARREGASLFIVLLAALQALLSRYAGQDDVIVGTPIANRNHEELEALIGCFVNTLALRVDLSGGLDFRQLLGRVREAALGAYAHQDLPFETLVMELRPERQLSRTPVFQVLLALHNAPRPVLAVPGLSATLLDLDPRTAKFDLLLALAEPSGAAGPAGGAGAAGPGGAARAGAPAGGLAGYLEFDAELFDRPRIQRLLTHLLELLAGAATEPRCRLDELPLLSAPERAQLLVEWADTKRADAGLAAVEAISGAGELFAAQTWLEPDATALVAGGLHLTYAALGARVEALAARLRRLAVGPEVRVGLCCERSPDMVVGLLGILAAGGACVPLDPELPAERLAYMLEDGAPSERPVRVVVRQSGLLAGAPAAVRCVDLPGGAGAAGAAGRNDSRPAGVLPDRLAYVLYTSGSTGWPKGVMNGQRGLLNRLLWMAETCGLGRRDRMLQKTPLSFDVALWEILFPLANGIPLVLTPPGGHRDPAQLAALIASEQITAVHFVPSMLEAFVQQDLADSRCLRRVICSGEALPLDLQRQLLDRLDVELWNLYGPTEAAIEVTAWRCRPFQLAAGAVIGRPVANTRIRLAGRHLEAVPIGVPGELCIGGAQVARGYLGRPDLTASAFVPDGFGDEPGARLYRTGDLARYLPDGAIEFLGRIDHQVKIRGFRIEPAEIEAALVRHPAVATAVVTTWRSAAGDQRLVAHLVAAGAAPALPAAAELRLMLGRTLPEHMVPAYFVWLAELPRTASGKLDRRRLPAPAAGGAAAAGGPAPHRLPRGPREELVAAIWQEVLGVEQVGASEGFFELGGHSLLAIRVLSRLRQRHGIELPLRALFEHPTVAALAELLAPPAPARPLIQALPRSSAGLAAATLPLSFAQERLWFLDRLEPASAAYNIAAAVQLDGALDVAALEASLTGLLHRHESLRTTFAVADGRPMQVIAGRDPRLRVPLPVVDLSALPAPAARGRKREALRLAQAHACRPFDLERGPLLRVVLVRMDEARHLVLVALHHIVADGWSLNIFVRELATLYAGHHGSAEHAAPRLPPLPVQYADYAVWQRSWLAGERLAREVAWWRQQLAGAPAELELPLDRPRAEAPAGAGEWRGGRVEVCLPPAATALAAALARRQGATLFMALLAAFETLLSRYSGQRDLVVGTPVASRDQVEIEGLIGFFANTLALRAELRQGATWLEHLAAVRDATLEAHAHQDLPFAKLVEELRPERRLGRAPLFQVMLAFQSAPAERLAMPDLRLELVDLEGGAPKFDLVLTLGDSGDGRVRGMLAFDRALFERVTVARLALHLGRLLEAAAASPERPLGELPLLDAVERQQLREWNATVAAGTAALPPAATLAGQLAARAALAPDAVAVVCGSAALSYGELGRRARALAAALRRRGVGPGALVGLCCQPSPALVVGLLGIVLADGVYLPLDPSYPARRRAAMIDDAAPRAVVAEAALAESLDLRAASGPAALLCLGWGGEGPPAADEAETGAAAAGLLYVIYSSGSTGQPKGAGVYQAAFLGLLRWYLAEFAMDAADRFLVISSISFDLTQKNLFAPLLAGGQLHLVPRYDAVELAALIEHRGITRLNCTPSACYPLAAAGAAGRLASLRTLFLGGEPISWQRLEGWLGAPGCAAELVNTYGPTECTDVVAFHRAGRRLPARVPIGRPLPGVRLWVLSPEQEPVPLGVAGQLAVAGGACGVGYLGDGARTAAAFRPDPFAAAGEPGSRLYLTGDLVRRLPAGEIDFLRRIDSQVKVRGFRVELGEIEAALLAHPGVREAVVLALAPAPGDQRLVACIAARGATAPALADLRRFLAASLPAFMLPGALLTLPSLPLSPNGKVDRRALALLAETAPARAVAAGDAAAPATPAEELLAGIWAEVLAPAPETAALRREDSFFELGGHSLLATQVVSRVREVFGVELPVRRLFEAPTLAEQAAAIEAATLAGTLPAPAPPPLRAGAAAVAALPADGDGQVLSFSQERLWLLDRLQPGNPAYNLVAAARLRGPLAAPALAAGLSEIVRRHAALRTLFADLGGVPRQRVQPPAPLPLPVVDLARLPSDRRRRELLRVARQGGRERFDLARGPLIRVRLLVLAGDEHVLQVAMHHVVADGWSIGVLWREAGQVYRALLAGEPPRLPPLPLQYADFAAWQRRWLSGAALEAQVAYWRQELAGLGPLDLPTDRPRPAVLGYRGGTLPIGLPPGLAGDLAVASRRLGATPFMTLAAAFLALLGRYTGQRDLAVGVPIAGRRWRQIEGLIGFFVNTLVLRADLSGNPGGGELLARVRDTTLRACSHQDAPFELLVDRLGVPRDASRSPLFQAMFALNNNPPLPAEALPGLALDALPVDNGTAKFELTLSLVEAPRRLGGVLEYNRDLFDAATIRRVGRQYERLLAALIAAPQRAIAELPLLDEAERWQLLAEWNDTRRQRPVAERLQAGFERQAALRPRAPALETSSGAGVSYGELERRANQLARRLRLLGVGSGDRVAVWMERSPELIVGLLGALKAGAAYVPCETSWPEERVHWILERLAVPCLLTSASRLRTLHDLWWRLPRLRHAICLDLAAPSPPPEPIDPEAVRALWDHVAASAADEITAGGFISAFTGRPFSAAEVDQYRDRVVELALPHLGPGKRVLEIGCGSGLVLFALAPHAARVVGIDSSPVTQERNRERAAARGALDVELVVGFAHQAAELVAGPFDLVVMASTVQFFPGPAYLEAVVAAALGLLAPGGALLVADVLDARRKDELRRALEDFASGRHGEAPARTRARFDELYLAPQDFEELAARLPAAGELVVHERRGFANELAFRYDVVLARREPRERPWRRRLWTAWHLRALPGTPLALDTAAEELAYVIFTSGSTGNPKGVMVQHAAATSLVEWVNRELGVGPEDRLLFVTSVTFDLSVYDVFGALAAGATLRIASEPELREPERLAAALVQERITLWDSAPAALQQLVPHLPPGPAAASPLRLVLLSGDWIPVALPDRLRATFGRAAIVGLGGATEATVWSNYFRIADVDPGWTSIPYGRPIAGASYHVLDERLQPVPVGAPGDLYIGGSCLAAGYACDPAQTAERFRPDPFAGPGARCYDTGDRARYRADGNLEFLGRRDHQVKLRGYRIELGEIEAVLARQPAVRAAAVVVREDRPGDRRLVAYVAASDQVRGDDLRAALRQSLPDYMVPAALVVLPALPVTANGKLDRKALPPPAAAAADGGGSYLAPRDAVEATLAAMWEELLEVERVGVRDNFFELGGHSLLASRFVAQVRESLRVQLAMRSVFETPTVAELAALLRRGAADGEQLEREAALVLRLAELPDEDAARLLAAGPAETAPLA
jgi:amino acid adenylation domain-containing protein